MNTIDKMEISEDYRNITSKGIPFFLRKIADQVEQNELTEEKIEIITEFLLLYVFNHNEIRGEVEIDTEEFKKFFCMGLYIYNQLKGE